MLLICSSEETTYRTMTSICCLQLVKFITVLCFTPEYSEFHTRQTEILRRNMTEITNPESVKPSTVKLNSVILFRDLILLLTYYNKQKDIYLCFIDYSKALDSVDHKKLWKMAVTDHLTCLLRNLYVGQEATVRTGHGTTDWFKIGKGI